ncbi:DUF6168 family protein [Mangrovimonas yunxiaonensis]|uniref:DUF6168 family protein n=1 Tax=Mangrovimonas yunxiaonensis TaxID=1197477 RepID=UPI000A6BEE73|nr:DUF6168 family protein [Mangrovimonas yunxiaonensis]
MGYILGIAIASAIAFFIHQFVLVQLEIPPYANSIVLSYVINTLLAIAVLALLFLLRKRLKDQLGFLFMAGSLLKFAVFFIVFFPIYNADGDLSRLEFVTFFIPYATCLFTETYSAIKLLSTIE